MSEVNMALQRIRMHVLLMRCSKVFVSCLVLIGLFLAVTYK